FCSRPPELPCRSIQKGRIHTRRTFLRVACVPGVGPVVPRVRGVSIDCSRTIQRQMRNHLFVSYATEDWSFVEWLVLRLTAEGYNVWCDRIKLLGGESGVPLQAAAV